MVSDLHRADPGQVGRYDLVGRLGAGGMGVVYLALDPERRAVAVKVMRAGRAELADSADLADTPTRERFAREVEVLARVRGRHVAEVLDADVTGETPYVVTRYVPGPRLDEVVAAHGPLHGEPLVALGRGLAAALADIHAAGVVHRDLTPGNVLLHEGEPVVIDFGIAHVVDATALTHAGDVWGTAGYLAPEQVRGERAGTAADVWAWGATVAFAGTGRPPFGTGRSEAVLYRVVHERPDLAGLDPAVAPLVRGALHPDPALRPSMEALGRGEAPPAAAWAEETSVYAAEPATAPVAPATPSTRVAPVAPPAPPMPEEPAWTQPGWGPQWGSAVEPDVPLAHRPWTLLETVAALATFALVGAGAVVAPLVTAIALAGALPLLRTGGHALDGLALRRARRGRRRRDGWLVVASLPWHLLRGLLDTLLRLPLAAIVAAAVSVPVWFLLRDRYVEERSALLAVLAGLAILLLMGLFGPGSGATRRAATRVLRRTAGVPLLGPVVIAALLVAVAVLVALAVAASPWWWPLDHAPEWPSLDSLLN